MEVYVPDIYQENIYKINYNNLKSRGIKCLLFDLDNTLGQVKESLPGEECKKLIKDLKKKGFKILITSNNIKMRVKTYADELNIDYISNCRKPHIDKIKEYIDKSKFGLDEIAIIGDSMMDDVVCGNTIGITTILLDQISKIEFPFARFKRAKEKRIQKKLRDKNLFTKGRYYV